VKKEIPMGTAQFNPAKWKFSPTIDNAWLILSLMKLKYLKNANGSNATNTPAVRILLGCFEFSTSIAA
jgi:hypothetical protein